MVRRWFSTLMVLLVLSGCGGAVSPSSSTANSGYTSEGVAAPAAAPTSAPAAAVAPQAEQPAATDKGGAAGGTGNTASTQNSAPFDRMVIRTASLTLLVTKADDAEAQVRGLVQGMRGYVLSSTTTGDEDRRSVQLTLKVPVENFDTTLNALEKLAVKVRNRTVTGQDVTDEFVDTESRLRNLHATEARLLEFLKDAKTVEEALTVNQQLTELQGQIEQASGRIQFLKQSTAFSTISVDLQPNLLLPLPSDDGWTPGTTAYRAWRSLLTFAQGIADIAIGLAIWSPVWGLIVLAVLVVWRRFGRRAPTPPPIQP